MCGIAGIQLHDAALRPRLGELLDSMLCQAASRGPDAAGVGIYGDPRYGDEGEVSVSVLALDDLSAAASELARVWHEPSPAPVIVPAGPSWVIVARTSLPVLLETVQHALPTSLVIGQGHSLAVLKGTGDPVALSRQFDLRAMTGWQGVSHTRMATESAVTPAHSHPFSVAPDLCLVHNGSFANHATIRRRLQAEGHHFDSDNDSEVGARFLAHCLAQGDHVAEALRRLCKEFDGFYTLLVTTADSFAVVRDAIACKPAVLAVTDRWVAMASEYRSLAGLPGIEDAKLFEPEPEEVYVWQR
jgi:methylamine---glutamate N-methyltransferase subunit A